MLIDIHIHSQWIDGGLNKTQRHTVADVESIADALEEKLTTPVSGMEPVGVGPDRPIATNETAEGKARNRRIEILIKPHVDKSGE